MRDRENPKIATEFLTAVPNESHQGHSRKASASQVWYSICLLLAVATYCYALDSQYIPKNGDEFEYMHITRLTAASGHLLPLVSQQADMRNTKPPLLFWQGIASTDWGRSWNLFRLRYPSVLYTLLTSLMAFLLARKWSGQWHVGVLAAVVYLSFFNVFRYGRPFLTEAPLMFWTFLPVFIFLFWQLQATESAVLVPVVMGTALGFACLYKSFVLVLPVGLALSWWCLDRRSYHLGPFLKKDVGKIAIIPAVALALFCGWFLLDPKPAEVFQEFVLRENVGRFDVGSSSYLHYLLRGGSSIWALAAGFFVNAGLLIFPVCALVWMRTKERRNWSAEEKFLWIWAASLFLIFSLPSMRSARYLLPTMPGMAVLGALHWNRISRKSFVISLLAAAGALAVLVYLCLRLQFSLGHAPLFRWSYWLVVSITILAVVCGLIGRDFTRPAVPAVALLLCLCLALALRPLDGPLGQFSAAAQHDVAGKQVWVPCNFRAVDEGYRFLLPGADVACYSDDKSATLDSLKQRYPLFAYGQPLSAPDPTGLRVVGERLKLRGRHTNRELLDMLRGNVFQQLFLRELLLEVPAVGNSDRP
ncbi:MAG TPA: phospholipid carrier-dependent glycosyltransferase [Candidatus Sulfotelmatobacter sp.]|nr:phospholipid carrier-dependent glycosyltransferase [Candidatus Sulfotelmatobacter sp.]